MEAKLRVQEAKIELEPIDIIIPTHNSWENKGLRLTLHSIEAIYDYTKAPFHLIVVDDSTDLTPVYFAELQKQHDNITFIHSDKPYKCGNQIFNIGLGNCKHDFVGIIMNSIRVEPDWEVVALDLMKNNPKIGLTGFKCLFPSGLIESAGIDIVGFRPVDIGQDFAGHRLTGVYPCLSVQWAFCLVRKEAAVGNLDENTYNGFVGWDDIDNSMVLRSKGWDIFYCGLGVGYHEPRATRGNNTTEAYHLNKENAEIFYKRWGYWDKYVETLKSQKSHYGKSRNVKQVLSVDKKLDQIKKKEVYAR